MDYHHEMDENDIHKYISALPGESHLDKLLEGMTVFTWIALKCGIAPEVAAEMIRVSMQTAVDAGVRPFDRFDDPGSMDKVNQAILDGLKDGALTVSEIKRSGNGQKKNYTRLSLNENDFD